MIGVGSHRKKPWPQGEEYLTLGPACQRGFQYLWTRRVIPSVFPKKGEYIMPVSIRCGLFFLLIAVLAGPVLAIDPTSVEKAWGILDVGVKEKNFARRHDAIH